MAKVTFERKYEQLRIYINGCVHIHLKLQDLIAFQSWVHGKSEFYIEYTYLGGTKVTSGYTEIEKWKSILKILDEQTSVIG
jgi:hypothetical protein